MPDKETELVHLAEADRHIDEAERHIVDLEELIADASARGQDTRLAAATLVTMRETLDAFNVHRDVILRTLDDIENGRL